MKSIQKSVKCKISGDKDSEGEVVYSEYPVNFYLADPETSAIIEDNHPLKGTLLKNKIVVLPAGKGSAVVQIDGLYQLMIHNNSPAGLVIMNPEPTIISAAYIANVTMATGIDKTTFKDLKNSHFAKLSIKTSEIVYNI